MPPAFLIYLRFKSSQLSLDWFECSSAHPAWLKDLHLSCENNNKAKCYFGDEACHDLAGKALMKTLNVTDASVKNIRKIDNELNSDKTSHHPSIRRSLRRSGF